MEGSRVGGVADLSSGLMQHKDNLHICGFYKDYSERLKILVEYYRAGLDRGELCIFVAQQRPEELIDDLKSYGLDIEDAVQGGTFRIYEVNSTYLPDGEFKPERMLDNLKLFVEQARLDGFSGVRGGGDMGWVAHRVPGWEGVGDYESAINQFIRDNNFTGLCLFHDSVFDNELTKSIVQTHQNIATDSNLHSNPYYLPPEESDTADDTAVLDITSWIRNLDQLKN